MFDSEFSGADDASVVAAIEDFTRAEATLAARRLAAIAELARRRVTETEDEQANRVYDGWAEAASEVGAAMTVSQNRASAQMRIAVALRDRLPKVAAVFSRGDLSARVVAVITWRTRLVEDDEAIALIDAAIAQACTTWGALGETRLDTSIDVWVHKFDPDAVCRARDVLRERDFHIGTREDAAETTTVYGRLLATDAETLKRRVTEMVGSLCPEDPRTPGERRSDAAGAIANGADRLPCRCGSPACPHKNAAPASNVVIYLVADTVDPQKRPTAVTLGGTAVSVPLVQEVIRGGATVRPVMAPAVAPERQYRPSAALAAFVRMRDLTCRFPGCDVPADRCDLDHTDPWPMGPTHPSNVKCLCRTNHLAKTFGGWRDEQHPDGTVVWTSPSGRRYITRPGSVLLFPDWDITTADLPPPQQQQSLSALRQMKMPTRRRTRAADNAAHIKAERAQNISNATKPRRPTPL